MPKIGMEPLRREALISATIDAIHDKGMAHVTMSDIARRAGVSAGLAHHYFGAKDRLLLATMRTLLAELGDEVQSRLADCASPQDRLRAIIRGNFSPCQFRPEVISAWLAFYDAAQHDNAAQRLLRIYVRRLESNLVHALQELTDRASAERIGTMTAALIDGVWIRRSLTAEDPGGQNAAQLVEEAVFAALAATRT